MARVKGAMMTRKHRKKILGLAKGYWGNKSRHYKMANQQMMKSGRYAYVGRKQKKRDFRQLWITRISAGCKANGMNYSTFMHGLKLAGIDMNRKMLSELRSPLCASRRRLPCKTVSKNPPSERMAGFCCIRDWISFSRSAAPRPESGRLQCGMRRWTA